MDVNLRTACDRRPHKPISRTERFVTMDFQNLEALIAFAIEKEKEAAEFYEENSQSETMSGKQQMLKEFAAEERKHQKMLEDFGRLIVGTELAPA